MLIRTYSLGYNEAPKSLNDGGAGSRRHWAAAHREKVKWEGIYGMLLLALGMPRGAVFIKVDAHLQFREARKRDAENYRSPISKPLADILVKGGWLADDTSQFFEFGTVTISHGLENPSPAVKSCITFTIEATYNDQEE
jgi:hypothetical protein